MLIKFIKRYSPYQSGEIAGFEDKEATRLINIGVAERYSIPRKPKTEDFEAPVDRMVKKPKVKK